MGEIEDRQELMLIARAMIQLGHELRAELKGFTAKGDLVINKLIEYADRMMPAVMDEREAQRGTRKKKDVIYTKDQSEVAALVKDGDYDTARELDAMSRGKRKRNCSICGVPGHRKTTCPQADKAYKAARKGKK
jgi:hypothetical protein